MSSPNIVIVDDSRAIQAILSRTIRTAGIPDPTIHAFSSGTDALAHVAAKGADLVITDWHMPGMTGLELLQAVRQIGRGDIKVGMVTTEVAEDHLGVARRSGATFIVNKPFKEAELHEAVLSALRAGAASWSAARPEPAEARPEPAVSRPEPAEARPEPPVEPVPPAGDVTDRLRAPLEQHFGPIRFRLVAQTEPSLAVFTPQILLSLVLSSDGRALRLVAMDIPVTIMLMGGAQRAAPDQIRPMVVAGTPVPAATDAASRFAQACVAQLVPGAAKVQSSTISRDLAKLRDAFAHADRVQSFKLQVPGYGEGYFALLRP
jgi:CheY-like chemotaxis protein